ncbi:MAG: hypothetical protein JNL58_31455 [Planctomyces sp.]|nr:hypothetical protein [Planctomyces sp.]
MFQKGSFESTSTQVDAFGVSMDASTMLLALALIDKAGSKVAALDVVKAASAIRVKIGGVPVSASPATAEWNAQVPVGGFVSGMIQRDSFFDPETVVTRTTSPAFDTPEGPMVCLAGVDDAVKIDTLAPVNVTRSAGIC